ncbi:hypothetical protein SAMN05216532_4636 [Streptomyces sp. 2231.1]|nr:hypothetical protein SAMN05216532_4636 [Streptomyces sp. 2231.1]
MKMPPIRAEGAEQGRDRNTYFFLPWVWGARFLPLVTGQHIVVCRRRQFSEGPQGARVGALGTADVRSS